MFSIGVDSKQVVAGLRGIQEAIDHGLKKDLLDVAHEILRLSQQEVPHDKGTLQNSGTVEPLGDDVMIGYFTKYAARLHEHPEYRFGKGRKGKYLEDPIRKNSDTLGISLANKVADHIDKGKK